MLGLRLGEYPSTGVFQRYPRDRRTAYGSKGCSCPGARLQVDLSRGFLGAGRSRLDPGNVLWDEVGSPFGPLELRQGCSGLQPQPFASSSFERLVCLSSSKEKERGGGDRNELLAAQAGALGFTPRDIHDSSRSSPLSGHGLVVPYSCSGPSSRSVIRYRRSHRVRPGRLPQQELSGGRLQVQPRSQKRLEYPERTVLSQGQSRPLFTKPF